MMEMEMEMEMEKQSGHHDYNYVKLSDCNKKNQLAIE